MARIKIVHNKDLITSENTNDVIYPVTSTKAIYDGSNKKLDTTLNEQTNTNNSFNTRITNAVNKETEDVIAINNSISNTNTSISNTNTTINNHKNDINNPHSVTKAQVGLSNVDNTSDINKPISIADTAELERIDNVTAKALNDINTRINSLDNKVESALDPLPPIQMEELTVSADNGYFINMRNNIYTKISGVVTTLSLILNVSFKDKDTFGISEYFRGYVSFTTGSTTPTITLPYMIKFATTPVFSANKTYLIKIFDTFGEVIEVS